MTCFRWARRCAVGVVLCAALSGCFPPADNQVDEKKEPHFLTGKGLIGQMDWQGAVDEFEKALEVNPHSASAHFELAWLNEEKLTPPDQAAAIYHYEQFLKLNPGSDKTDLVKQHVNTCKLELVKNMAAVGGPTGPQRELERVVNENKDLQNQIAQLQAQVAQLKSSLDAANAAVRNVGTTVVATSNPPQHYSTRTTEPSRQETSSHVSTTSTEEPRSTRRGSSSTKSHTVRSHETMASIARQYGVSLAALEAANPQIRPTHLMTGQTLKVPSP